MLLGLVFDTSLVLSFHVGHLFDFPELQNLIFHQNHCPVVCLGDFFFFFFLHIINGYCFGHCLSVEHSIFSTL